MGFRQRIAELARGEPAPESQDPDTSFFTETAVGDFERREPEDDDLETYWELYKQEPLVREPIRRFADDVVEPGYKVYADDPQLEEDLEDALQDSAIIAGESGHDFREVLHQSVVQREVRGTAMCELVPRKGQEDDPDSMWGFRLINAGTCSALTYDEQNVLINPNDTERQGIPVTPRGEAAAYIQFDKDATLGPFDSDKVEVPLSQNDVVKLTTDADTSDIFGTSRVEAVAHEVQGLRQIKRDNEEAIAAKAYPHWIIKAGSPDPDMSEAGRVGGMWPDEKMKQLRSAHSRANFKPGQKDVVPGDVEFQKISGETADVQEVIKHYVEHILAAMPTPKYSVGFSDDINRDVTGPQSDDYQRLVQRTRRALEDAYQKALQRKARDLGYEEGTAKSVSMRVEPRRGSNPLKDDSFDIGQFQSFMQGVATANQVSGRPVMTRDEIRTRVLGLEQYEDLPEDLKPVVDDPESEAAEQAVTSTEEETGDDAERSETTE